MESTALLFIVSIPLLHLLLLSSAASCPPRSCQVSLLDSCSTADDCAPGLYCGSCPASGNVQPACVRALAYQPTAFEPAINTLKEVEVFLTDNPSEIVTIIIEDYVRAPKGLTKLFTDAGLVKFWYPVSEMPMNGMDWPSVTDMVAKNHRLLVFTSDASKEANEGIAYQWRYMVENEPGDPGVVPGSCPNRKESQPLNSRYASLFLQNYFPTIPVQNEACKEHSVGFAEMVDACYRAAGNIMPNFLAVNFYMVHSHRELIDCFDLLCYIGFLQAGAPMGVCKNTGSPNRTSMNSGGTYSGYVQLSGSASMLHFSGHLVVKLLIALLISYSL
ncbi:hypothetical protein BHE74_00025061 [Ensete ventricosum]|nr:hypothetical protein BHE74_00025061 [Ensete ventricosum]